MLFYPSCLSIWMVSQTQNGMKKIIVYLVPLFYNYSDVSKFVVLTVYTKLPVCIL